MLMLLFSALSMLCGYLVVDPVLFEFLRGTFLVVPHGSPCADSYLICVVLLFLIEFIIIIFIMFGGNRAAPWGGLGAKQQG
jgi:hypothetical protein